MMDGETTSKAKCRDHRGLWDLLPELRGDDRIFAEAKAREVCGTCPIFHQCMAENVEMEDDSTFRAGLNPRQWRAFFKKRHEKKAA